MPESRFSIKNKRFNFIDFILCIVAVAVLAVGIWAVVSDHPSSDAQTPVSIVIEFSNVDNEIAGGIAMGDTLCMLGDRAVLGTVKSVSRAPETYKVLVSTPSEGEGEQISAVSAVESTLYSKLTVTVSANAENTAKGVAVNGYRILCGETVQIYGKTFAGEGKITSIFSSDKEAVK